MFSIGEFIELLFFCFPFPHRESNLQHLSVLELTDSGALMANKFGKDWTVYAYDFKFGIYCIFIKVVFCHLCFGKVG